MIERSFSADRINAIINDPSVRPDVAELLEGSLDISSAIASRENVHLVGDHGGLMFFKLLPGVYEVHTVCLKSGRGQWAYDMVRQAANYMFTHTDCYEITTRIPKRHDGARMLAIRAGMTYEFSVENGCVWRGERQDIDVYSYRLQDWIKGADELVERGRWFHERLREEAVRVGITDQPHKDDDSHFKYVGAALEMALSGQIQKGLFWYNRWCLASRHPTVTLAGINPLTIHMDIGFLTFKDGDIELRREQ